MILKVKDVTYEETLQTDYLNPDNLYDVIDNLKINAVNQNASFKKLLG